jgi:hypothetical protein
MKSPCRVNSKRWPHIMAAYNRLSWLVAMMLAGLTYGFIGIVFAVPSSHVRLWRLAAWIASGIVYVSHIAYERYRLHKRPLTTALHAAAAVALGAFVLAVGATVHAAMLPSHIPYWRFRIALVVWPIITAVPAFIVALVFASLLTWLPSNRAAPWHWSNSRDDG